MRIVADTNVLLRVIVDDDPEQSRLAAQALEEAEIVAISLHSLCEMAWVLDRRYEASRTDIADAIRRLIGTRNVAVDRPAVEAGLSVLDAGGDFADGVIAHEGRWLGGESFISFDRRAVRILAAAGQPARLLG